MEVNFKMPQLADSIIMVAGVGGGGGNAVRHMYLLGVTDVAFMVINTDKQALERNPIPLKIQLGNGLGAGNNPEKARLAALESEETIREALSVNNTKMLFVTAGMGGGTGTGASPVVARIAKQMGILTVGIVSIPYKGEGPKRVRQAVTGIEELLPCVDSLIIINNEHIAQIHGKLGIKEAHSKADDILAMAAKSIADMVTNPMDVNVDFEDVTTVMKEESADATMGKVVLMGSAVGAAEGGDENRALKIAEEAVNSPLLHHNDIRGARKVLLNITWGDTEVSYDEALQVMDFIQQRSGLTNDINSNQTDVIWGAGEDPSLGNNIRITVIATGFDTKHIPAIREYFSPVLTPGKQRIQTQVAAQPAVLSLDDDFGGKPSKSNEYSSSVMDEDFSVVGGGNEPTVQTQYNPEPAYRQPQRYEQPVSRTIQQTDVRPRVQHVTTPAPKAQPVESAKEEKPKVSTIANEVLDPIVDSSNMSYDQPAYLRRKVSLYSSNTSRRGQSESLDDNDSRSKRDEINSLF